MLAVWANLGSDRARSICGAIALHVVVLAMLAVWLPRPPAGRPNTISVELIEIPFAEVEAPVELPDPDPEADAEMEDQAEQVQQADRPLKEDQPLPAPEPESRAVEAIPEVAEASGVALVDAGEVDQAEAGPQPEKPEIDPRYVIQYDPFSEAPPSAFARVGRAINCVRVNRATRPAFCPDYDDDDIAFAILERQRQAAIPGARPRYDPVYDIAATQNVLERFSGRQTRAVSPGGSELGRIEHLERHPDGLKGCTSNGQTLGLDGANGGAPGGGLPLGSTDGVFCN